MLQPLHSNIFSEFSHFGDSLIAKTRELVLSLWSKNSIHSELKEDQTPVSEVDLCCEELVSRHVRQAFPLMGL
jgi:hypothetical protein